MTSIPEAIIAFFTVYGAGQFFINYVLEPYSSLQDEDEDDSIFSTEEDE